MEKMRDKKLLDIKKTKPKMSGVFPYTNYFKCKWIKLSKQKAMMGQTD